MALGKSQALAADLGQLRAWATAMRTKGDLIRAQNEKSNASVDGTREYWRGEAATTARADFDRLYEKVRLVAEAHHDLAAEADKAAGTIEGYQRALRAAVSEAEQHEPTAFRVEENGTVIVPALHGSDQEHQAHYEATARDLTERIRRALDGIDSEDARAAKAIDQAAQDVPAVSALRADAGTLAAAPPLTEADAKADAEALADGHLTAAERARIDRHLAAAGMDEKTLPAALNGTHPIPQANLDYLQGLQKHLSRDGLLNVSRELADNGSPAALHTRQMLANSVLTVSNDKVVGIDEDGRPTGDKGGWNKLNPEIREFVTTRAENGMLGNFRSPDANTTRLPDDYRSGPSDEAGDYHVDMSKFAGLLAASGEGFEPGRNFAVQLDRLASHQAHMLDHGSYGVGLDPQRGWQSLIEQSTQRLISVGGRNEDATHALLTGSIEGVDREDVFMPLLTHDWEDDGAAVGGTLDWISAEATDPATAQRAGEAARGLADLLSTTDDDRYGNIYDTLLNLDGEHSESIGEVNPELVQHIGQAMTPYIANLAQVNPEVLMTKGFSPIGFDDAASVFSIIDSDKEAATEFNAHVFDTVAQLQGRWAESALADPGNPDYRFAEWSGMLQSLADQGLHLEAQDRGADATAEYASKKESFERLKDIVDGGLGRIPVFGESLSMGAGWISNDLADTLLGEEPRTDPHIDNARAETGARQLYNVLQILDSTGKLPDSPDLAPYRDRDGNLVSFDDALAAVGHGSVVTGRVELSADVTRYLEQHGLNSTMFLMSVERGRREANT